MTPTREDDMRRWEEIARHLIACRPGMDDKDSPVYDQWGNALAEVDELRAANARLVEACKGLLAGQDDESVALALGAINGETGTRCEFCGDGPCAVCRREQELEMVARVSEGGEAVPLTVRTGPKDRSVDAAYWHSEAVRLREQRDKLRRRAWEMQAALASIGKTARRVADEMTEEEKGG